MMTGTLRVNGGDQPLAATIADLAQRLGITPETKGVAVALNGAVVPRAAWPATVLKAGDAVEVIRALQGG